MKIIKGNVVTKFIREAYAELKKVAWPKRSNVIKMAILVVSAIVITSALIGAFDYGISKLIKLLIEIN